MEEALAYLADESPEQAARYVGAFKAVEATGSAIATKESIRAPSTITLSLDSTVQFIGIGWICAQPVVFKVKEPAIQSCMEGIATQKST